MQQLKLQSANPLSPQCAFGARASIKLFLNLSSAVWTMLFDRRTLQNAMIDEQTNGHPIDRMEGSSAKSILRRRFSR
jgi:hypothetical protein